MNILLLTQFLSTTKGGGEYVFSVMANGLANSGHNVWIITHKIENEDYAHFHKNVKVIFASSIKYEGSLPPSLRDNIKFALFAIRIGSQLIKKEKIDLIHSNNFSPALAGSMLSSLTSKPHITTVHDVFSLCGKRYWKLWGKQNNVSRLNVLLAPFFEKMIIRLKHHAIHTVSEATQEDLIKFGAKKPIYVIHNSIEINQIEKTKTQTLQFVYVGRLVFYKNLETVIRAIQIVKKLYPRVTLIIAGGGPHKDSLVRLVADLRLQDNVRFTGYVSEKEKMRLLSTSNALIFPSLCEGFGLVILESFSCNRPVIVSNVRPLSDIVDDKINGLVVESKDNNRWAEAMISLISEPEKSLKMGREGKKKLDEMYTQDKMITRIDSMYHDVIQQHDLSRG